MNQDKKIPFNNLIIMIGFGSIGRALLPLIYQKFEIKPSQLSIIASDDSGIKIAQKFGVSFQLNTITSSNYLTVVGNQLLKDDFLINVAVNVSTAALIKLCEEKGALYMDTSIEPWEENFIPEDLAPSHRTNYMLRENTIKLKGETNKTAIMTHGANPGLISHFVKQALWNMAQDNQLCINMPKNASEWANVAMQLDIKTIHIAESDTQISSRPKLHGEFVNTWSIEGLIDEGLQPAELGWGSHESHWPHDAFRHDVGCQSSIYLTRPGASTRVRSWIPSLGGFHGFLITHPETISISNFLTLKNGSTIKYRPTVHYAYSPCPDATLSLLELGSTEWQRQTHHRLIFDDITQGSDELGVLLMGNKKGAYWFGSTVTIDDARKLAPYNNATSLQVVAGVLSGMIWAIDHPNEGIVEPEDIDHQYILNIALPYLGTVAGHYTDWTPLMNRQSLFSEELDLADPWQFINIRVN